MGADNHCFGSVLYGDLLTAFDFTDMRHFVKSVLLQASVIASRNDRSNGIALRHEVVLELRLYGDIHVFYLCPH